jgi:hypothetical protein
MKWGPIAHGVARSVETERFPNARTDRGRASDANAAGQRLHDGVRIANAWWRCRRWMGDASRDAWPTQRDQSASPLPRSTPYRSGCFKTCYMFVFFTNITFYWFIFVTNKPPPHALWAAEFGLIGTVTTGFLGMHLLAEADAPRSGPLVIFVLVFVATTVLTVYTMAKSKRLSDFLDVLSDERATPWQKCLAFAAVWRREKR